HGTGRRLRPRPGRLDPSVRPERSHPGVSPRRCETEARIARPCTSRKLTARGAFRRHQQLPKIGHRERGLAQNRFAITRISTSVPWVISSETPIALQAGYGSVTNSSFTLMKVSK